MPVIHEYQRQESGYAQSPARNATGEDFGAGIGAELSGMGYDLNRVAVFLRQKEEDDAVFNAQKVLAEGRTYWQKRIRTMMDEAPEGAANFTSGFDSEFTDWQRTAGESIQNDKAKKHFALGSEGIRASLVDNAVAFESASHKEKVKQDAASVFDNLTNAVRGSFGSYSSVKAQEDAFIQTVAKGNERLAASLRAGRKHSLEDAALDGFVSELEAKPPGVGDISEVIDAMKAGEITLGPGFKDGAKAFSPKMYDAALTRLDKLKQHVESRSEEGFNLLFKNAVMKLSTTGVDDGVLSEDIIRAKAKTGSEAAEKIQEFQRAKLVGAEVVKAKDTPDTELYANLQRMEEGLKTAPAESYSVNFRQYEAAHQAYNQRVKEYKADPAAYAMGVSPAVGAAAKAYSAAPSAASAAEYAAATLAEQRRLSPSTPPRLMTDAMLSSVKADMDAIPKSENGVEQAKNKLQSYAAVWGAHWPQVASEMFAKKSINDVQYVVAGMWDKPGSQAVAAELLRASAIDEKDLAKQITSPGVEKNIATNAESALAPLRASLVGVANKQEIYEAHFNALRRVLLAKSMWSGKDASSEAKDYADKIVLGDWSFVGNVRIPKAVDASTASKGLDEARATLPDLNYVLPYDNAKLREPDAKKRYVDALTHFGKFATSGDGSGVRMLDQHDNQVFVAGPKGEKVPLRWTWTELQALPDKRQQRLMDAERRKAERLTK